MSTTFQTAPTQSVDVNGTKLVFREIGSKGGVPVVLLHHLTAVLDDWDPRVVDGLAAKHHVIAFDNRGVGGSGGATPGTVEEMASDAAATQPTIAARAARLLMVLFNFLLLERVGFASPAVKRSWRTNANRRSASR